MIGTRASSQQFVAGRLVRFVGSGLAGIVSIGGLGLCILLNLTTRQTSGCIVESGPDIIGCLIIITGAGLTAALLCCARTTTAALVGSLLLGVLAMAIGPGDEFSGFLALGLAGILLMSGVVAKCLEEFPGLRPATDQKTD